MRSRRLTVKVSGRPSSRPGSGIRIGALQPLGVLLDAHQAVLLGQLIGRLQDGPGLGPEGGVGETLEEFHVPAGERVQSRGRENLAVPQAEAGVSVARLLLSQAPLPESESGDCMLWGTGQGGAGSGGRKRRTVRWGGGDATDRARMPNQPRGALSGKVPGRRPLPIFIQASAPPVSTG